jgi:hypothetical protein
MDKFMMLTRRFLRQIFTYLAKSSWSKSGQMATMFGDKVVSNSEAALGFRLHFTDIYLEELAKIGGEDLDQDVLLTLIEPFALEVANGDDDRLVDHIEERIYQHLMRQSDLGIAHDEGWCFFRKISIKR